MQTPAQGAFCRRTCSETRTVTPTFVPGEMGFQQGLTDATTEDNEVLVEPCSGVDSVPRKTSSMDSVRSRPPLPVSSPPHVDTSLQGRLPAGPSFMYLSVIWKALQTSQRDCHFFHYGNRDNSRTTTGVGCAICITIFKAREPLWAPWFRPSHSASHLQTVENGPHTSSTHVWI